MHVPKHEIHNDGQARRKFEWNLPAIEDRLSLHFKETQAEKREKEEFQSRKINERNKFVDKYYPSTHPASNNYNR